MKDTNAVVFVMNSRNRRHQEEISLWYDHFVGHSKDLNDQHCMVFALKTTDTDEHDFRPSNNMRAVEVVNCKWNDHGVIKSKFDGFLGDQ